MIKSPDGPRFLFREPIPVGSNVVALFADRHSTIAPQGSLYAAMARFVERCSGEV
jgi:hypothetical protein